MIRLLANAIAMWVADSLHADSSRGTCSDDCRGVKSVDHDITAREDHGRTRKRSRFPGADRPRRNVKGR